MVSPLMSVKIDDNFRIYPTDIGLLTSMFDYSIKKTLFTDSFDKAMGYLRGGLYEALIADMLYKNGHDHLYFRKTEQGSFEIDFLLDDGINVIPVEVKAGNSKSRSLDNALKKDNIPYGYKLITGNAGKDGKKITLPLYMAMFL